MAETSKKYGQIISSMVTPVHIVILVGCSHFFKEMWICLVQIEAWQDSELRHTTYSSTNIKM
jgi:hypothetical protein